MTSEIAHSSVKLRRITINRFRGLDNLELDFVDPRNKATSPIVLGGPNGSGKTRAIEACMMALGRFDLIHRARIGMNEDLYRGITRRELNSLYSGANISADIEHEGQIK